jgi:hypothetical protein
MSFGLRELGSRTVGFAMNSIAWIVLVVAVILALAFFIRGRA